MSFTLAKLKDFFHFRGLYAKLVVISLILVIMVILTLGLFSYFNFKQTLLEMAKRDLMLMSRQITSEIAWHISQSLVGEDLEKLTSEDIFSLNSENIKRIIWNGRWLGLETISFAGNVYLLDLNGKVLFNSQDLSKDIGTESNYKVDTYEFKDNYGGEKFLKDILNNQKNMTVKNDYYKSLNKDLIRIKSNGYITYVRNGEEYIASYSKVNLLNWVLVVDGKKEDILAPANGIGNIIFFFGFATVIVVTFIISLIAKHISSSINSAVDFANEIASGNLSISPLKVDSQDEIGNLVEHLNDMRSNLEITVTNMKNLLDNAGQGFLSISGNCYVDKEYSAECKNIFGFDIANKKLTDILFLNQNERIHYKKMLKGIFGFASNGNLNKSQELIDLLPKEMEINNNHIECEYKLVKNKDNFKLMVILTDITEKKEIQERAIKDGLTGLYNQTYFKTLLSKELDESSQNIRDLSLLMIDIDNFKSVNDTYGHQVGDEVLRSFAKVLKENLRGDGIVARYGGEEFAIVLPEVGRENAIKIGRRINRLVRNMVVNYEELALKVTVSIGVASYTAGQSSRLLITNADKALYQAKIDGKDRLCVA
jgi:diguanylate cyclase (GGDEF)-like protein